MLTTTYHNAARCTSENALEHTVTIQECYSLAYQSGLVCSGPSCLFKTFSIYTDEPDAIFELDSVGLCIVTAADDPFDHSVHFAYPSESNQAHCSGGLSQSYQRPTGDILSHGDLCLCRYISPSFPPVAPPFRTPDPSPPPSTSPSPPPQVIPSPPPFPSPHPPPGPPSQPVRPFPYGQNDPPVVVLLVFAGLVGVTALFVGTMKFWLLKPPGHYRRMLIGV